MNRVTFFVKCELPVVHESMFLRILLEFGVNEGFHGKFEGRVTFFGNTNSYPERHINYRKPASYAEILWRVRNSIFQIGLQTRPGEFLVLIQ